MAEHKHSVTHNSPQIKKWPELVGINGNDAELEIRKQRPDIKTVTQLSQVMINNTNSCCCYKGKYDILS